MIISLFFLNVFFIIVNVITWKSDSPVSTIHVLWNVRRTLVRIRSMRVRSIRIFVTCWQFYEIYKSICFTKSFHMRLTYPTLKFGEFNIFSYFEECKSKKWLMLPDSSLSLCYEDNRTIYQILFHFVDLIEHKGSLYDHYLLLEGFKEYLPICIT